MIHNANQKWEFKSYFSNVDKKKKLLRMREETLKNTKKTSANKQIPWLVQNKYQFFNLNKKLEQS